MKYFFPELKDKKKQLKSRDEFLKDMNFALNNGKVYQATERLNKKPINVSHRIFNALGKLLYDF